MFVFIQQTPRGSRHSTNRSYLSLTSKRSELRQNANQTLELPVGISGKRDAPEFQPQEGAGREKGKESWRQSSWCGSNAGEHEESVF